MITVSIDVTKLDKSRFKAVTRKNGDKALFCDLILMPTPESEFGDYMVKQSLSKEDRENGVQLPILGNGKNVQAGNKNDVQGKPAQKKAKSQSNDGDDIPF
jgi:hypothetical protein